LSVLRFLPRAAPLASKAEHRIGMLDSVLAARRFSVHDGERIEAHGLDANGVSMFPDMLCCWTPDMLRFTLPTREVRSRGSVEERVPLSCHVSRTGLGSWANGYVQHTGIRHTIVYLIDGVDCFGYVRILLCNIGYK